MKIFIDRENKKILILDIILSILVILLIVSGIYIYLNPQSKLVIDRDTTRESDINKIFEALSDYSKDENSKTNLQNVSLCVNGWTEIGKESSTRRINLASLFGDNLKPFPVDPLLATTSEYSGYDICRNYDGLVFKIRAIKSESKTIEITKKIFE